MERSVDLARMIQRNVCNEANRPDKGVHQAGFLVLRETSMPSCLIELGFITTPDEEQLLNTESRVDDIAKAIYEGFAQYKNKYDKRVTVPYRSTSDDKDDIPTIVPKAVKEPTKTAKATPKVVRESPKPKVVEKVEANHDVPVFKVQILVSSRVLRSGDAHFKGETGYESYQEGGMMKYTLGNSTNYNEIYRLRKSLLDKFPEAFIIAFKDGQKYDVNQAIREFKQNKK